MGPTEEDRIQKNLEAQQLRLMKIMDMLMVSPDIPRNKIIDVVRYAQTMSIDAAMYTVFSQDESGAEYEPEKAKALHPVFIAGFLAAKGIYMP